MSTTLYQTLCQNTKAKDISVEEKSKITETVLTLNNEEKEALFLLIYEHFRTSRKKNTIETINLDDLQLPYGISETVDGIQFSLSKIPLKLRQIILKFINIVDQNKKDDK